MRSHTHTGSDQRAITRTARGPLGPALWPGLRPHPLGPVRRPANPNDPCVCDYCTGDMTDPPRQVASVAGWAIIHHGRPSAHWWLESDTHESVDSWDSLAEAVAAAVCHTDGTDQSRRLKLQERTS